MTAPAGADRGVRARLLSGEIGLIAVFAAAEQRRDRRSIAMYAHTTTMVRVSGTAIVAVRVPENACSRAWFPAARAARQAVPEPIVSIRHVWWRLQAMFGALREQPRASARMEARMGLMNALRNLFGAGGTSGEAAVAAVEYQGYRITPAPQRQPSGWNTAGVITKDFPDGVKEHRFVRVDTHTSKDDAVSFSITKAQQIIDEQGDRIFRNA